MIHARQPHGTTSPKEDEYLQGWQRERAALANFRKQVAEQSQAQRQQALRAAIEPLLSIADNFQAIIRHVPPELKDQAWVAGVLHVARQLEGVLKEYNVTVIEATGVPFDPKQHEAIADVVSPKQESGHVVEVVVPGYRLGDQVIRPAKVKVSQ